MLNKKLVLGSLAGATLLVGAAVMVPSTASAALMTGTCSNCHTMHDSVDGNQQSTGGPNAQLLKLQGCFGCHATANVNDASGRDASFPNAPQVNDPNVATMANGGYFDAASTEANGHDVSDAGYTLQTTYLNGIAPGSTTFTLATSSFDCIDCHGDAEGGHHTYGAATAARTGAALDSYRMLRANTDNDALATPTYEGGGVASTMTSGDYNSGAIYVGPDIDGFCADCHGAFHGGVAQGSQAAGWVRHPTGVAMSTMANAPTTPYTGGGTLPLGNDAAGTLTGANQTVMCISCHKAHGTAVPDMLRFTYATQQAGSTNGDGIGCELCHGAK